VINFRYLLFAYNTYYPVGGFNDFIFKFSTFEEFKEKLEEINIEKIECQHFQILDLLKLESFNVLYLDEPSEVNIKSKLKRAVRGYFQFDKTR